MITSALWPSTKPLDAEESSFLSSLPISRYALNPSISIFALLWTRSFSISDFSDSVIWGMGGEILFSLLVSSFVKGFVVLVTLSDTFSTLSGLNYCVSKLGNIANITKTAEIIRPNNKYVYLFKIFMLNQKLSITL